MNIDKAIQTRVTNLCKERNIPVPVLKNPESETTIEEIELFCDQIQISLRDFFVNDIFRK